MFVTSYGLETSAAEEFAETSAVEEFVEAFVETFAAGSQKQNVRLGFLGSLGFHEALGECGTKPDVVAGLSRRGDS